MAAARGGTSGSSWGTSPCLRWAPARRWEGEKLRPRVAPAVLGRWAGQPPAVRACGGEDTREQHRRRRSGPLEEAWRRPEARLLRVHSRLWLVSGARSPLAPRRAQPPPYTSVCRDAAAHPRRAVWGLSSASLLDVGLTATPVMTTVIAIESGPCHRGHWLSWFLSTLLVCPSRRCSDPRKSTFLACLGFDAL